MEANEVVVELADKMNQSLRGSQRASSLEEQIEDEGCHSVKASDIWPLDSLINCLGSAISALPSQVLACHMELAEPSLATALQSLNDGGESAVVVVPYFFSSGKHVRFDIPRMIKEQQEMFPEMSIKLAKPLGLDWRIASLLLSRFGECIDEDNIAESSSGEEAIS